MSARRVTRNVDPAAVRDLLERPPRACLAFNDSGKINAFPIAFRFADGRYRIGLSTADPRLVAGTPVTLLIDDGLYFFELRSIKVRGRIAAGDAAETQSPDGRRWLEVVPEKVVAWDYGSMRAEETDATR